MAGCNITWTETKTKNIMAQKLGFDVGSASLPNDDDMVTSVTPIFNVR